MNIPFSIPSPTPQSAALQLTTDWCQWENSQTEDKQYVMGFWFFKLLIRTRASNYTHSCLFSSWRQRKQNLLGVVRITTLFLTQNEYGSSSYTHTHTKSKVQGMSGQRRIEGYFSVYSLYSVVSRQDSGLQIVGHMQGESWYTGTSAAPFMT